MNWSEKKQYANTSHCLNISHQSVPVIFSSTPPPRPEWAGAWHKPQDEFHKRRRGRWNRSQRPTTRKALRPPHHHPHLSNETKTWLFVKYIRDGNPTQLCRDLKKKAATRIPSSTYQPTNLKTSWNP